MALATQPHPWPEAQGYITNTRNEGVSGASGGTPQDDDEEGVSKEYHVDVVRGKGKRFMHGEPIDLAATLACMQQPMQYSRQGHAGVTEPAAVAAMPCSAESTGAESDESLRVEALLEAPPEGRRDRALAVGGAAGGGEGRPPVGRAEAGPGEEETGAAAAHGESRKAAKKRARAEEKPVRLKVVIREGKNRQVRGLLLSLATD